MTGRVTILLFSTLREQVGTSSVELQLSEEDTPVSMVFEALCSTYPSLVRYRGYIRIAINGAYAEWASVLKDGDEIALVTPVSGG